MMTLKKSVLIDKVIERLGKLSFSKSQVFDMVETVLETMKQTLERGEKVKISSFGVFTPKDKRARMGRNPKTGESVDITARRVVTFKASPILKKKMNDVSSTNANTNI